MQGRLNQQLSGPGSNQTVLQPGTQSAFRPDDKQTALQPSTESAFSSPVGTRQFTSPATSSLQAWCSQSLVQARRQTDSSSARPTVSLQPWQEAASSPARQPAAFELCIAQQPSSPTHQSLDHHHMRVLYRPTSRA